MEPLIRATLLEAMTYAKAGLLPPGTTAELDLPDARIAALDADPKLAAAFHTPTPSP